MFPDARADDQIAARPAERAGIPLAGHADLRAGVDASGNRDVDRLGDASDAPAKTRRAPPLSAGAARPALRTR